MNLPMDRDFVAQAAIVLAVCVGAWVVLVKPKVEELGKLEQSIAEAGANSGAISQDMIEGLAKRMGPVRERVAQIEASNRLANDSSRLYGTVMTLADEHKVKVQSLQPGSAPLSIAEGQAAVKRLEMTVEGSYQNIAAFLDAINELHAFVRPLSLQISPTQTDGAQHAIASFSCDVLTFKLGDALSVLAPKELQ